MKSTKITMEKVCGCSSGVERNVANVVVAGSSPAVRSKKDEMLGMPFGTAAGRLRKLVMFMLVQRAELDMCHRCGKKIKTAEELSIEHTEGWYRSMDPIATFFDVTKIAFSHFLCNSTASKKPKKYDDPRECERVYDRKNQKRRLAQRDQWRSRKRAAGLPYT
jgi:hypothetical protein